MPPRKKFVKMKYMIKKLSELLGIARFKIQEGKLEEYKRLSAEAIEIARTKDTGTPTSPQENLFLLRCGIWHKGPYMSSQV